MTQDQVSAFDAANQEARDAAKALFEKSKNGDIDKDTLREGLKNIFAAKNEKMAGIFDDSQLEIIKIHKALSLRKKKHKSKKGKKGKGVVAIKQLEKRNLLVFILDSQLLFYRGHDNIRTRRLAAGVEPGGPGDYPRGLFVKLVLLPHAGGIVKQKHRLARTVNADLRQQTRIEQDQHHEHQAAQAQQGEHRTLEDSQLALLEIESEDKPQAGQQQDLSLIHI